METPQINNALEAYFLAMPPSELFLLISLSILLLALKGLALWVAAQNNSKGWFIALLFINTLGILELAYLFFFSKRKKAA
jgi:methionyl-tRNA synthetase